MSWMLSLQDWKHLREAGRFLKTRLFHRKLFGHRTTKVDPDPGSVTLLGEVQAKQSGDKS